VVVVVGGAVEGLGFSLFLFLFYFIFFLFYFILFVCLFSPSEKFSR